MLLASVAQGGAQVYQPLSASVRSVLHHAVSDQASSESAFVSPQEADVWLSSMSSRLEKSIPNATQTIPFTSLLFLNLSPVFPTTACLGPNAEQSYND